MKRTTNWLFIALVTFILGITAAFLYLKFNNFQKQETEKITNFSSINKANENAEIPTISFCELAKNPEYYNDKIVRLIATLEFGLEGAWFSISKCVPSKITTLVFFENDKAAKLVEDVRKQKPNKFWANTVNLTVVGKFKNQDPRNCCIIASSQFEIQQVEKAEKETEENN